MLAWNIPFISRLSIYCLAISFCLPLTSPPLSAQIELVYHGHTHSGRRLFMCRCRVLVPAFIQSISWGISHRSVKFSFLTRGGSSISCSAASPTRTYLISQCFETERLGPIQFSCQLSAHDSRYLSDTWIEAGAS